MTILLLKINSVISNAFIPSLAGDLSQIMLFDFNPFGDVLGGKSMQNKIKIVSPGVIK